MAFFPKDEYVPRRGVAMKVKYPNVEPGEHRDTKIEREVKEFVAAPFVLNNALDKNKIHPSKVKTFDRRKGEHDVIAHCPEPQEPPKVRLHDPLSDTQLKRLMSDGAQMDKDYARKRMESSPGMVDKFSEQRPEKFHKHTVQNPEPTRHKPKSEIHGFKGLGKTSADSPRGKIRVQREPYDPLRLKFPLRDWKEGKPVGIRTLNAPAYETIHEHFHYDDGAKLEDLQKRPIRHGHVHKFPVNYGPDNEIEGFRGLGSSDTPAKSTGKHYIPATDHATNASPYASKAPYRVPPLSYTPVPMSAAFGTGGSGTAEANGAYEAHYTPGGASPYASQQQSGSRSRNHPPPQASTPQPMATGAPFYSTNESQIVLSPEPQKRYRSDFK